MSLTGSNELPSLVVLCRRCYSLSLALNLAFQSGERAETHQLLKSNPGRRNILPHSHKQRLVIDMLACLFCLSFFLSLCAIASVLVEWENIIKRIFSWPASGADLAGKTNFTLTVISQRSRDHRTTARCLLIDNYEDSRSRAPYYIDSYYINVAAE